MHRTLLVRVAAASATSGRSCHRWLAPDGFYPDPDGPGFPPEKRQMKQTTAQLIKRGRSTTFVGTSLPKSVTNNCGSYQGSNCLSTFVLESKNTQFIQTLRKLQTVAMSRIFPVEQIVLDGIWCLCTDRKSVKIHPKRWEYINLAKI